MMRGVDTLHIPALKTTEENEVARWIGQNVALEEVATAKGLGYLVVFMKNYCVD